MVAVILCSQAHLRLSVHSKCLQTGALAFCAGDGHSQEGQPAVVAAVHQDALPCRMGGALHGGAVEGGRKAAGRGRGTRCCRAASNSCGHHPSLSAWCGRKTCHMVWCGVRGGAGATRARCLVRRLSEVKVDVVLNRTKCGALRL